MAVVERHVRARWSLPLFASTTTLAFVLIAAIPVESPAGATVVAPAQSHPVQTLLVAGERATQGSREDYSVTERPQSTAPASGVPDAGSAQAIAYAMVMARGWSTSEYDCLVALWNRESRWNVYAHNPSSGAYGIPQALPGDKMKSAGDDWATNPATQITWGLGYIAARYGSPCGAWDHSERKNWY